MSVKRFALRVSERTDEVLRKYFDGNYSGHITLSKDGFGFRTDCSLHLDSGITLEADFNATDAYASADQALVMIEKRLRRYKSRLKDRRPARPTPPTRGCSADIDAPSYVIEAPAEGDEEVTAYSPVIIAEATTSLKRLSVSEAVMELSDRGRLHRVPARLQRPGEHHLPAGGRQCRLGRSSCGNPLRYRCSAASTPPAALPMVRRPQAWARELVFRELAGRMG